MAEEIGKVGDLDKSLLKVVYPEGEIEAQINNKTVKIFWVRQGFGSRIYYKAYARKKVEQFFKEGLLAVLKFDGPIDRPVDGKETFFPLPHQSIIEETLKVFESEALTTDYVYNPEASALYFSKPPNFQLKVSYNYYEPSLYKDIVHDATTVIMIFLSARTIENQDVKYFNNVEEVEKLSFIEIANIVSKFNEKFAVTQEEIKNLQPPLASEDAMQSPKISI